MTTRSSDGLLGTRGVSGGMLGRRVQKVFSGECVAVFGEVEKAVANSTVQL
ncbi:hypothetical protein WKK05_37310 (plasmid) [Nostoc sp. UHCC 0302]|uniref:hypothetical protein n=1 Tax=Nostoc sp. UHCC 0302 TaxID=3134896 RepID=UPI00311CBEB8